MVWLCEQFSDGEKKLILRLNIISLFKKYFCFIVSSEAKIKVIFTRLAVLLITDLKNQEKILLIVTLLKSHQEDQKILLQWKLKV